MMLSGLFSNRSDLSTPQTLELANFSLINAHITQDTKLASVLCEDAASLLSQVKRPKRAPKNADEQTFRERVADTYQKLGKLQEDLGHKEKAQTSLKAAEKWSVGSSDDTSRFVGDDLSVRDMTVRSENRALGSIANDSNAISSSERSANTASGSSEVQATIGTLPSDYQRQKTTKQFFDIVPQHVFAANKHRLIEFRPPGSDGRLANAQQLAYCLEILRLSFSPGDILDPVVQNWLRTIDRDEQERLKEMVTGVAKALGRDELKDPKTVAEVMCLVPVIEREDFRYLLKEFYSGIDQSSLLDVHQLEGLASLIQDADPGYFNSDDLVRVLSLLNTRLRDIHQQSRQQIYRLTLAVSHILDAMADTKFTDMDREMLNEPLSAYLRDLRKSSDPYLVYQAAYAYQALLCVPDVEKMWQLGLRPTGNRIQRIPGLVSSMKSLDLSTFIEGLVYIQQALEGVSEIIQTVRTAYDDVTSLAEGGRDFLESLREGFSFRRKCAWYSALRAADVLIRDGQLVEFKKLVSEVPCRCEPPFQWGVCQRLGEIALDPMWDEDTRRGAIAFLGEIYRHDEMWGQQASVKQWILKLLMQLAVAPKADSKFAKSLLHELATDEDHKKQILFRACQQEGTSFYPLKVAQSEFVSPSLLDRVQKRPDVEGKIRQLKKQCTKDRENTVYLPLHGKANLRDPGNTRFLLKDKVREFLESSRKVLLLVGDSGAGKSTFSRELEFDLWQAYQPNTGTIPLYIDLPAIDDPECDIIVKQLRKSKFTERDIRELKKGRNFVLICDGYDEARQTNNLYATNQLNQPGEWNAKMVISCRSEYIDVDYRERFQPGYCNQQSDSSIFQEVVIMPLTLSQVQDHIKQYVNTHNPPWGVDDYMRALQRIPSLKELVKNPYLMTLSLEVFSRMVNPGRNHLDIHITRVGLYDHFIGQWLEQGKKRLEKMDLDSQAREAFEGLKKEGFTQRCFDVLKRLSAAIYREQGGRPIVNYSSYTDVDTWKATFFGSEKKKQLLLMACPLTRSGDTYRFNHQQLQEYGLVLAMFDPKLKTGVTSSSSPINRRVHTSSPLNFKIAHDPGKVNTAIDLCLDVNSTLATRSLVKETLVIQLSSERVQQEPVFERQLLSHIEHSKKDKKWRIAAANSITILVRAGVQFNSSQLQGIQIPGADLSDGSFELAQLQGADLRNVNLRGVRMHQTNLSRAQMTGVKFGELPFLAEDSGVHSFAYTPDGKSFAVGLNNGNIRVYSTTSWERIRTLSGHGGVVWCVVYSPKGDQMASSGQDKSARLWDVETGECQRILHDDAGGFNCVAYSPQGNRVATASDDETLRIWDAYTGNCLQTLRGHSQEVISVTYSPQGDQLASGGVDCTVRLWSIETGECTYTLSDHNESVTDIVYSPEGEQLATASSDSTIRLWDARTGSCLHILSGHSGDVTGIAFSPKGDQIASTGQDQTVRLWDVQSGACYQTLTGHCGQTVKYSPNGTQIASGGNQMVQLWDMSVGASHSASCGHSMKVNDVKCSPNGNQIASCSSDRTVRLWDMDTGACRRTLSGHSDSVFSIAYSCQGDLIASGSGDKSVWLWELETGRCRYILTGHSESVYSVAFSSQGNQVASASDDKTIRLWSAGIGICLRTLDGHEDRVRSVAYSPNGKQLASGSKDGTARIWDAETGECCRILQVHSDWVRNVVYSLQGTQLATTSDDMTIRLWDVETGECRSTFGGHGDVITSVAYSLQDGLFASSSLDKTVRLWNHLTGQCREVIQNLPGLISSVAWNRLSDTNYLITGCEDGSILSWRFIEEEDRCRVRMCWGVKNGSLIATGAYIQDVRGLTSLAKELLKQRGATGEPFHIFREAGKKLSTMASVVSKLQLPSESSRGIASSLQLPREQKEKPTDDS